MKKTRKEKKKYNIIMTKVIRKRNKLGQFTKAFLWSSVVITKSVKQMSLKLLALTLIVGLNATGLLAIGETVCHFNDTETSSENIFQAATLDFRLTNMEENEYIGVEADGELKFTTVAIQEVDSLDIQYEIKTEKIGGDDDFCSGINLIAKKNGMTEYSGNILSFAVATSTEFGTWEFELDAPPSPGNFAHGDKCKVDFVFNGWREDVADSLQSGFDDEERINVDLKAKMIVLNEYLPNPIGDECSTGGEWVELFNNGNEAVDLNNWKIKDEIGDITIVSATTTFSGSTMIGAKGSGTEWLVVYLDGCVLNNNGDSLSLSDSSNILIDSTSYLGTVIENKSNARISDGIGAWVDPVPTPGGANKLVEENSEIIVEGVDTEAPVITINGNNPAYLVLNANYSDLGAMVSDNVNDNLGIHMEGNVDTAIIGEYEIIYTATDGAGNNTTATRLVVVYDPIFGVPETDPTVLLIASEVIVGEDPVVESTGVVAGSVASSSSDELEETIENEIDSFTPEIIVEEVATSTPEVLVENDTASSTPEVLIEEETTTSTPEIIVESEDDIDSSTPEIIVEGGATSTPEVLIEKEIATSTPEVLVEENIVSLTTEVILGNDESEDPIKTEPIIVVEQEEITSTPEVTEVVENPIEIEEIVEEISAEEPPIEEMVVETFVEDPIIVE